MDTPKKSKTEAIIESLEKALREGDWTSSLFLQTTGKKLQNLLDRMHTASSEDKDTDTTGTAKTPHQWTEAETTEKGYMKVYVHLFQAQGTKLINWTGTLQSLAQQSVSRSIYENENDIKALIRTKQNSPNEAYATVLVKTENILPQQNHAPLEDRFGHPLVRLKENAIQESHIIQFAHISGLYLFRDGKLEKSQGRSTFLS